MKTSFGLFVAICLVAGAASASDLVQHANHQNNLKTSRSAQCNTPSGKLSKECAASSSTQDQHAGRS
jgi:hypothetical protein